VKKFFPFAVFFPFFFCLLLASCVTKPASQKISASKNSAVGSDAEADVSLGALPKKGLTEAEKEAARLLEEDAAAKELREIHKREAQEEAQRLQRSITEFDSTEKQQ